jgi:hypothetical protein
MKVALVFNYVLSLSLRKGKITLSKFKALSFNQQVLATYVVSKEWSA